jgi:opacity protein-like surface antigen
MPAAASRVVPGSVASDWNGIDPSRGALRAPRGQLGIRRMSKLAGLFGLALVLAGTSTALADRFVPVPAPVPVPETFSYYLRGDLGWGFSGDPSYSESGAMYGVAPGVPLDSRSIGNDSGVFFGSIGTGVYFSPRFRGDLTLDFRGEQSIDVTAAYTNLVPAAAGTVRDTVRLRGTVGMANIYWDLMPRGHFTPYVGAGIGFVYNQIERDYLATHTGLTVTGSGSDNHFGLAGALMAGISISTDHRFVWDFSYRALYMDGGSTTTNLSNGSVSSVDIGSQWEHQFRVGVRVNLW